MYIVHTFGIFYYCVKCMFHNTVNVALYQKMYYFCARYNVYIVNCTVYIILKSEVYYLCIMYTINFTTYSLVSLRHRLHIH